MSDETNSSEVAKKESEQQKAAGNDVNVVAEHYNSKDKGDLSTRSKSRIFYLRNFNNWIKSVLIKEYVNKLNASSNSSGGLTILDLGCGRGGDIRKWMKASNVRRVTFSDLAEISLDECKSRYEEMRPRFKAEFIHLDATRGLLSEKLGKKSFI
jgi:mRNA (guanine-N7-)-methyltransferase